MLSPSTQADEVADAMIEARMLTELFPLHCLDVR